MGLRNLPMEVIEDIAEYLNFEDLRACSKVNAEWEYAFDVDRIWKRFCSFPPNYFEKQVNKTNYSPVKGCQSKIQAFNEKYVCSNHLSGKFDVEEVSSNRLYCDTATDFIDQAGTHWLLVSCMDSSSFESEHYIYVWNLNNSPSLHSSTKTHQGKITRIFGSEIKIHKENVFLIQNNYVLMYHFAYPLYELKFIQKFCFHSQPSSRNVLQNFSFVTVGKFVVGCKDTTANNRRLIHAISLYVWNLNGVLVYKDKEPRHRFRESRIVRHKRLMTNNVDKVIIVSGLPLIETDYIINVFDVSLLSYTDFSLKTQKIKSFTDAEVFCDNVLSVLYVKPFWYMTVECYTIDNHEKIFKILKKCKKDCDYHALIPSSNFVGLAILLDGMFEFINLSTKKTISLFQIPNSKDLTVTVLNSELMMVRFLSKGIQHEVWNFKTGFKLYNFAHPFFTEQSCCSFVSSNNIIFPPKLIVYKDPNNVYPYSSISNNNLAVISFW